MPRLIWIASYPKSGNTWTRLMLRSYLAGPTAPSVALTYLMPDFHFLLNRGMTLPMDGSEQLIAKTHFLPGVDVLRPYEALTSKVVYLVRNPRDVLLSAMRHLAIAEERKAVFARDFIANSGVSVWAHSGWGTWPRHVTEWGSPERLRQHFPGTDLLAVRYEDLRSDPVAILGRIVEFLGLGGAAEPERLKRAVENTSLDRMRAAERIARSQRETDDFRNLPANGFFGEGLCGQSLASIGSDVEAAYEKLLTEDEEFSSCARRFGYFR